MRWHVAGHLVFAREARHFEMHVGINETGGNNTSTRIESVDAVRMPLDFGTGSHHGNVSVSYQDCFGCRAGRVHRHDARIDDSEIVTALGQCL